MLPPVMKKILGVICLLILLGGIYLIVKPRPVVAPPENTSDMKKPEVKKLSLEITEEKLTSDLNTFAFTQGDTIEITIASDIDSVVHFHGYDKYLDVRKEQPVKLEFTLDTAGKFPFELEERGTELGTLIVNPK